MAKLLLLLTGDEINEQIPYALICETMGGSRWNTGKRRRAYAEEFTEGERRKCRKLYEVSCNMYLRRGVPTEMSMRPATLQLWHRLAKFCCSL